MIASVVVHLGYFAGLIEAYRAGDMSQVYPIARGSAPLLTALVSTTWLGERLGLLGWIGLLCLVGGVMMLSLRGGGELARLVPRTRSSHHIAAGTVANFGFKSGTKIIAFPVSFSIPKFAQKSRRMLANFGIGTLDRRAVGFALFTALTVCAYTVIDGIGVRAAGDALAYTAAAFLGNAVIMALYGLARRGPKLLAGPWRDLAHGTWWWRAAVRLIRHRAVGDDGRADRGGGGAARDQRAVRRADRGRGPARAAAGRARAGGGADRGGTGDDQGVLSRRVGKAKRAHPRGHRVSMARGRACPPTSTSVHQRRQPLALEPLDILRQIDVPQPRRLAPRQRQAR